MARTAAWLLVAGFTACQWPGAPGERTTTLPPAEFGPGTPLGVALALLQVQLDSAVDSGLDETSARNLDRAEAISDRLLETRLPFAWLSAESYSLEARLRQIQTRTDRAQALRAGGGRRDEVFEAVEDLRGAVAGLRAGLVAGGTVPPPPVRQLLTVLDTASR